MKVNVSIDDALLSRVDEYASRNYLSRSGFISQAIVEFFEKADALKAVQDVSFALMKIADTGVCDDRTLQELRAFEHWTKLISGR